MYIRKELKKYIDDLASRKVVPGGGSASALVGAIGIALTAMVAGFTLGSDRYRKAHAQAKEILRKTERLRRDIQLLIDKDIVVFLKLRDILRLRSDDMRENTLLQKCLKDAANVPFEICAITKEAAQLCYLVARIGNINLISDTGGAIYLIEAAFKSAALNVKINLKYISDKKFARKKAQELKEISAMISRLRKSIIKKTEDYLEDGNG